jgi:hypothetical protein
VVVAGGGPVGLALQWLRLRRPDEWREQELKDYEAQSPAKQA